MKKFIAGLAAILALCSCSSYNNLSSSYKTGTEYYNETYRGCSHADIVKVFGAPDRETSDGADGYILVYETFHNSSYVDRFGYIENNTYKRYIQFFMSADGICYNVRTNRNAPGNYSSAYSTIAATTGIIAGITGLGLLISWLRWPMFY